MALQNAIISNMLTRAKRLILYTPSIYKFCPIYAIADQSKAWKDKNPHAILLLGPGCVWGELPSLPSCHGCLRTWSSSMHGRSGQTCSSTPCGRRAVHCVRTSGVLHTVQGRPAAHVRTPTRARGVEATQPTREGSGVVGEQSEACGRLMMWLS
jgi:hypothetical protein